jgi:UDP-glucose 4-epimerase
MTTDRLDGPFAGRRVLVTGGLGFIGSHLARALVRAGAVVTVVDSLVPNQGGNPANIADIEKDLSVSRADLRDARALRELVAEQDIVFNLAGQTSHVDSMEDPLTDLEMNCRSQLFLLEACRRLNPRAKIVFASTRQIYGRPQYLPVDEQHPIAPVDINGINKSAGEGYHLLYAKVYGLRVTVLRLTNTYGPCMRVADARQTFLGEWLRRALTGRRLVIYGDGTQRRDFNYVDDAVRAFLAAAASDQADGSVYNLGSAEVVTLREVAEYLIELNGGGSYDLKPFPADREVIDIGDYFADFRKITEELGWQPSVPLTDGLARSLEFFRVNGEKYWGADA